jgi:uncharacterized protein (TIGR03435 family)
MAQNLLEDRFQLKLHRETREMPVYLLTQDKNGVKVKVTPDTGAPRGRGGIESVERGWFRGQNLFMQELIGALSQWRYVERPILDRTNYSEAFTFDLKWDADLGTSGARPDAQPEEVRPSLFTALREQMGLKLEPQKAPVEVLVIDHVERPSEN